MGDPCALPWRNTNEAFRAFRRRIVEDLKKIAEITGDDTFCKPKPSDNDKKIAGYARYVDEEKFK